MKIIILTLYLLDFCLLFSQEYFINSHDYIHNQYQLNIGKNWEDHTTIGSSRYNNLNYSLNEHVHDSLIFNSKLGLELFFNENRESACVFFHSIARLNNFYVYSHPRIVTNGEVVPRFSGLAREKSRFNFNAGEVDMSGIGYDNRRFIFQIGRGRQSWGSGDDISIVLSDRSRSYDYFLFGFKHKKIRYRYFNGFLENKDDYLRYISGRGIEYHNNKNFIISFSEISIYSGLNRPLDFSYLNPISSHLEIDMNDRANKLNSDQGNASWQFSLDWMIKSNIRISSNLVIDEFKLDKVEIDSGRKHGLAFSISSVFQPNLNKRKLSYYINYIYVGSNTFRHEDGYNNFVTRNFPLGWQYGSDCDEINFGLKYFSDNEIYLDVKLGYRRLGSKTLMFNTYDGYGSYETNSFPASPVKNDSYISSNIYKFKKVFRTSINFSVEYSINNDNITFLLNARKFYNI